MKQLTIILLTILALYGIHAGFEFACRQYDMYQLQQINMLEVERCTEAMRLNPDLICD